LKLIEQNALKTVEQKLLDLIVVNLNWQALRKAIKSQFSIKVLKDITVDRGNILILDNEIVYQLHLGPETGVSVLMDRSGELIEISFSESMNEIREKLSKPDEEILEEQAALEDTSALTSEIAAMISQINETDQGEISKTEG